jgi:hypothetical protein
MSFSDELGPPEDPGGLVDQMEGLLARFDAFTDAEQILAGHCILPEFASQVQAVMDVLGGTLISPEVKNVIAIARDRLSQVNRRLEEIHRASPLVKFTVDTNTEHQSLVIRQHSLVLLLRLLRIREHTEDAAE